MIYVVIPLQLEESKSALEQMTESKEAAVQEAMGLMEQLNEAWNETPPDDTTAATRTHELQAHLSTVRAQLDEAQTALAAVQCGGEGGEAGEALTALQTQLQALKTLIPEVQQLQSQAYQGGAEVSHEKEERVVALEGEVAQLQGALASAQEKASAFEAKAKAKVQELTKNHNSAW